VPKKRTQNELVSERKKAPIKAKKEASQGGL
jgi:hypothetical protein